MEGEEHLLAVDLLNDYNRQLRSAADPAFGHETRVCWPSRSVVSEEWLLERALRRVPIFPYRFEYHYKRERLGLKFPSCMKEEDPEKSRERIFLFKHSYPHWGPTEKEILDNHSCRACRSLRPPGPDLIIISKMKESLAPCGLGEREGLAMKKRPIAVVKPRHLWQRLPYVRPRRLRTVAAPAVASASADPPWPLVDEH